MPGVEYLCAMQGGRVHLRHCIKKENNLDRFVKNAVIWIELCLSVSQRFYFFFRSGVSILFETIRCSKIWGVSANTTDSRVPIVVRQEGSPVQQTQ